MGNAYMLYKTVNQPYLRISFRVSRQKMSQARNDTGGTNNL